MPDTPENQAAYPQPPCQAPGVGFPLARMVVLLSLATAMVTGMAIGQGVRTRMKPEVFRRWFLIAMIFLGIYLAGSAIYSLML